MLGDFSRRQNSIDGLHSLLSCSETKCTITLAMCILIAPLIALHHVKNGENRFSSFELKWVRKIVLRLGRNLTNFVHLPYWHSETDWNITILISAV